MPSLHTWCRRVAGMLLLSCAAGSAHATLITFDERPWVLGPDEYAFYSNPIADEYADLGVHFSIAYLQPNGPYGSYLGSQYVLGSHGFTISFSGATLPTFVSFVFGSPMYDFRTSATAYGADGRELATADTGGSYIALPEYPWWVESPYEDTTRAAFHNESGIAAIIFHTETNPRLEAKLDNLYFGNVPAVPEPATLALWATGLGLVGAAARRRRQG